METEFDQYLPWIIFSGLMLSSLMVNWFVSRKTRFLIGYLFGLAPIYLAWQLIVL